MDNNKNKIVDKNVEICYNFIKRRKAEKHVKPIAKYLLYGIVLCLNIACNSGIQIFI